MLNIKSLQTIVGWRNVRRLRKMLRSRFKKFTERYEIYIESAAEFLTVFFVSNGPFIVLILMHLFGTEKAQPDLSTLTQVIYSNMQSGEIFIYISALLAPFFWVIIQYHRAKENLPYFAVFLIATGIAYVAGAIVFSMYRLGSIKNAALVSEVSIYFYVFSLIIWYFSLVFAKKLAKSMHPSQRKSGAEVLLAGLKKGDR